MEPSTNLRDALIAIKNKVPTPKPYYNKDGFRANPPLDLNPGAYWPQQNVHDLPIEQFDWRDDIKD